MRRERAADCMRFGYNALKLFLAVSVVRWFGLFSELKRANRRRMKFRLSDSERG